MIRFYKQLFLDNNFFYALSFVFIGYILSFFFPSIYIVIHIILCIVITALVADIIYLFKYNLEGKRHVGQKLSNGDDNTIRISIKSTYPKPIICTVIDEIPFQFQYRNFNLSLTISPDILTEHSYTLRPIKRGEYIFGDLNIFTTSKLGFAKRRFKFSAQTKTLVYPSFLQLKKYAYLLSDAYINHSGNKQLRRLGHTLEFEQIKEYVQGDNIRNLNWKATAKRNMLMLNQYQDQRAQQVYAIIDKGRVMQMPFNGMSLLDYAINSSLFLLNVVSKKEDKAGLLTFSNKIDNRVVAEKRGNQLQLIQENLYNIETDFKESNFGSLYTDINKHIRHRSLLLIYTNFETKDALNRQLKYLKALVKSHLVLVIFFSNTEVESLTKVEPKTTQERIEKVIAETTILEKKQILKELSNHGILGLLSSPEHLSIDVINTYLTLKNQGHI